MVIGATSLEVVDNAFAANSQRVLYNCQIKKEVFGKALSEPLDEQPGNIDIIACYEID